MTQKNTTLQKVHFRLTLLCGGITTLILLAMSCAALFVSEKGLRDGSFRSFQNDMNTILSNVEQQTVIHPQWLLGIEDQGKYMIRLLDNGIPFLFNERNLAERQPIFKLAWEAYETQLSISAPESAHAAHTEFQFYDSAGNSTLYYGCVGLIRRGNGTLQLIIVMPQLQLRQQILRQRLFFTVLNIIASACLMLFSSYFTKKLLQPIETAQKKQNRFIADASHELRTPLAVILACVSASRETACENPSHFLDNIESEGLRMSRLIDDLLLLTRADNHAWTLRKEPADADTLVLDVYEAFEPLAAKKHLRTDISLPEAPLPECSCDRERIYQALAIILHNAVSYTPEYGKISLSLSFDGKFFHFQISDNGIGIPDKDKPYIFDRFYRSDRARNQKEHFGLGLSIAAEIVHAHHGQIHVNDTPGGGSTFTVLLPLS